MLGKFSCFQIAFIAKQTTPTMLMASSPVLMLS